MGCDGGTIPKRDELVRTRKKPEQKDKASELYCKWRLCSSTQEPLRSPIVACELGRLFNKESVLEILLDKSKAPDCARHLRNMKDVKEIVLTQNPSFQKSANKGDAYDDVQSAEFNCPVLGVEMNGKFRFCFIWTCGCVMSERALREIKTSVCHNVKAFTTISEKFLIDLTDINLFRQCQKSFEEDDIIVLNPSEEDLPLLDTNMEARRLANKNKSKALKRVAGATEKNDKGKKLKTGLSKDSSKIAQKLLTLEGPDSNSLMKKPSKVSIAEDPNASEVFKSLFTTCEKALNQTKGHWVTYNPHWN